MNDVIDLKTNDFAYLYDEAISLLFVDPTMRGGLSAKNLSDEDRSAAERCMTEACVSLLYDIIHDRAAIYENFLDEVKDRLMQSGPIGIAERGVELQRQTEARMLRSQKQRNQMINRCIGRLREYISSDLSPDEKNKKVMHELQLIELTYPDDELDHIIKLGGVQEYFTEVGL